MNRELWYSRGEILQQFLNYGFKTRAAFYNVCKSIDSTLNAVAIYTFWDGQIVTKEFHNKLESVLDQLAYE